MRIRLRRTQSPGHAANRLCPPGASARSGHFPPGCGMEGTKRQCRKRVCIKTSKHYLDECPPPPPKRDPQSCARESLEL
jgi:hypothetical protein